MQWFVVEALSLEVAGWTETQQHQWLGYIATSKTVFICEVSLQILKKLSTASLFASSPRRSSVKHWKCSI